MWKLIEKQDEDLPYVLQILVPKENVLPKVNPYLTERYATEEEVFKRARFLNSIGHNVQVLLELGYCINEGDGEEGDGLKMIMTYDGRKKDENG